MRFVIRNLVDVDEASPATAPEIVKLTGEYLEVTSPRQWCQKFFLMACGSSLARCLKFFFVGGDGACSRWWLP
jgi:hypothetical protein